MASYKVKPLDPKPVRYRGGGQRTAQLRLLKYLPEMYVFDPREGFSTDRERYRQVKRTRIVYEIEGAYDE